MKTEQLWLSDTGKIVCERISCAGPELFAKIVESRGLDFSIIAGGDRFSRLSKSELAEFAPLIAGTQGELACDGGHVHYNLVARELRAKVTA